MKNSSEFKVRSSKKRHLRLTLCFLLVPVLLCGCAKREIKNADSQGANIICFGDSLTFGYGVNPGEDYPATLAKLLRKPVINAGIDGDTTTTALRRIQSDVLDRRPRLVIIEFGGNDFLKKVPQEETIKNLREMVDLVQARGAMVAIIDISAGIFFAEYRKMYKRLAEETGCIFVPRTLSGIITNPAMKSDFLHPNADGYKIIAYRVLFAIRSYLK